MHQKFDMASTANDNNLGGSHVRMFGPENDFGLEMALIHGRSTSYLAVSDDYKHRL